MNAIVGEKYSQAISSFTIAWVKQTSEHIVMSLSQKLQDVSRTINRFSDKTTREAPLAPLFQTLIIFNALRPALTP
jgi:hypothetical protein